LATADQIIITQTNGTTYEGESVAALIFPNDTQAQQNFTNYFYADLRNLN